MSNWIGVMAVDPGGSTGVVCGVVPRKGEMAHRVKRMKLRSAMDICLPGGKGKDVITPCVGAEGAVAIAYELCLQWTKFADYCLSEDIVASLVIEDYIGSVGPQGNFARGGGGYDAFDNVRILAAFESMLWYGLFEAENGFIDDMNNLSGVVDGVEGGELIKQMVDGGMGWLFQPVKHMPSQMSVITDDRLKRWGLWERGRPHSRDAWRHWVIRLRNLS